MPLVWLALAWLTWCGLHSLLIHPPVEQRLSAALNGPRTSYRLLYNLFSLATLLPVAFFYLRADATPLLTWPGWSRPFLWLAWATAAILAYAAARAYDMSAFLGLRPQGTRQPVSSPARSRVNAGSLRTDGILRYSRHPWYLAGLLLLWCRDLTVRDLLTNVILTGYLLIGIRLEERKLLAKFGSAYQRYRNEVPMLLNPFRRRRP